ncbi:MAG TPA: hypothetical protein VEU51_09480 [Candidatus Acidoferrales bacterium]|nr:hypothetical protein [Candidatus Acidoferrales bacterium]
MKNCPKFRSHGKSGRRVKVAHAISLRGISARTVAVTAAAGLAICFAVSALTASAANVSGMMSYRNGAPADKRQLHYENRVTGDMYVAPTNPDGTFKANLPPGLYDLRAERGVILARKIRVDAADVNIGHVVEPAPLDVHRPFQREGVAEAIVVSPAPSTANLTGRPLEAMQYGHEVAGQFGAPQGTPAPESTPLGEETPVAVPSPSTLR